MYSQVYWTRNNPIALPPQLVRSQTHNVIISTFSMLPSSSSSSSSRSSPLSLNCNNHIHQPNYSWEKNNLMISLQIKFVKGVVAFWFPGEAISRSSDGNHRLRGWSGEKMLACWSPSTCWRPGDPRWGRAGGIRWKKRPRWIRLLSRLQQRRPIGGILEIFDIKMLKFWWRKITHWVWF